MASLALLVAIIFLVTLLSGPIALFFSFYKFKILSIIFSILALISGINWTCVAPFPISLVGLLGIFCALYSIKILFFT